MKGDRGHRCNLHQTSWLRVANDAAGTGVCRQIDRPQATGVGSGELRRQSRSACGVCRCLFDLCCNTLCNVSPAATLPATESADLTAQLSDDGGRAAPLVAQAFTNQLRDRPPAPNGRASPAEPTRSTGVSSDVCQPPELICSMRGVGRSALLRFRAGVANRRIAALIGVIATLDSEQGCEDCCIGGRHS